MNRWIGCSTKSTIPLVAIVGWQIYAHSMQYYFATSIVPMIDCSPTNEIHSGSEIAIYSGSEIAIYSDSEIAIYSDSEIATYSGSGIAIYSDSEIATYSGSGIATYSGSGIATYSGSGIAIYSGWEIAIYSGWEIAIHYASKIAIHSGSGNAIHCAEIHLIVKSDYSPSEPQRLVFPPKRKLLKPANKGSKTCNCAWSSYYPRYGLILYSHRTTRQ
ncbi:MAG: hypothetical protein ACYTBZ_04295 [Planctomycetota bacterium]|jgi:uncharacterized Fe-S cluster protein YjdI